MSKKETQFPLGWNEERVRRVLERSCCMPEARKLTSRLRVPKKKRDLFTELTEGFDALAGQRAGKRTLRTHTLKAKPAPRITPRELAKVRKGMNMSRGLFAEYLRTNVRTLENWEQGRAKPNAQAALLIRMVQRYPDTVRRLAEI